MRKVLWTTKDDRSEEYFKGWEVCYYEDGPVNAPVEKVYFRDPFNNDDFVPEPKKINEIMAQYGAAKSIDGVRTFLEIQKIEDKYQQYLTYGDLMPKTWLATEKEFVPGEDMAKLRISQRAKGILFELDRKLDDKWIVQERMNIGEEIRVYAVYGKVFKTASIKSSKQTGNVKVLGTRELTAEEEEFAERVTKKSNLDFLGMDIAIMENGERKLIEVNRSPQFKRYAEITGVNLAEYL